MSEGPAEPEDPDGDEREPVLDQRQSQSQAGGQRAKRAEKTARVMSAAAKRDDEAAARDWAASKRDMAANVQAWLSDDPNQAEAEARGEALDDRLHSAADRKSSALDRSVLAEDDDLDEV